MSTKGKAYSGFALALFGTYLLACGGPFGITLIGVALALTGIGMTTSAIEEADDDMARLARAERRAHDALARIAKREGVK